MTVAACRIAHYRLPREVWWPEGPIGASAYEILDVELVTCEVETDEGVIGSGFTYTVGRGGSAVRALLEDVIAPELMGREPRDVEAIWHELRTKLHFVGLGGVAAVAIAAADIALWDALAVAAGLPLYRYLGVHRASLPAYASAVNLALSTGEVAEQMAGYRGRGFRAVKMKVGKPFREDVERVRAVREAIGDDCELYLDANMAWDVAEAARRLRAFERYDVGWLEEPFPPHDVDGYATLQRLTATPLAAGDPHFIPEIHVHLACAVPNALNLEYLPIFERLLERPLEVRDGRAAPPESPGHGMRFSAQTLVPYRQGEREVRGR